MIRAALFYLDAALRGSAKIFCRLQLIIFRDIQKKRTAQFRIRSTAPL
jgi:hypothetical protein